jgi:metal-dependent amidase/aminoacylase/carboxypeptidase family protein
VIGTPAEEGGGGKIVLLDQGVFDGVDVAMMSHPAKTDSSTGSFYVLQRQVSWLLEARLLKRKLLLLLKVF